MAGDDQILIKIAVFGMAMSVFCTAFAGILLVDGQGDYDYDQISGYRADLVSFSGESMLNSSPWVLTGVYTPWIPEMGTSGHVSDGWLYGTSVSYADIGKSADIRLDAAQKSAVPLGYTDAVATYVYQSGMAWWNSGILAPLRLASLLGVDPYSYAEATARSWDYTGYRYVFDPTLPFSSSEASGTTSTVDGELSIVWYAYNGQGGLSGGLDIYGGRVLLASYSAADIVTGYGSTSGYATTYDFDFEGTHIQLSVKLDQDYIEGGVPLMQAWNEGRWSMAVSSVSAGNFFDITESTSFANTAGNMIDTFVRIYTFNFEVDNPLINTVLWLVVGLPMTMAMLLIALKLINGFRVL